MTEVHCDRIRMDPDRFLRVDRSGPRDGVGREGPRVPGGRAAGRERPPCKWFRAWATVSASRTVIGLLLALIPAGVVAGDPYVFVEGGVAWSFDRSNTDEVEFGDEPGGSIAGGIGWGAVLLLAMEGGLSKATDPAPGLPPGRQEGLTDHVPQLLDHEGREAVDQVAVLEHVLDVIGMGEKVDGEDGFEAHDVAALAGVAGPAGCAAP